MFWLIRNAPCSLYVLMALNALASGVALAAPLGANDASWLFPLNPSNSQTDGFCNAPQPISAGMLTPAQFKSISSALTQKRSGQVCRDQQDPYIGALLLGDAPFLRQCNHLAHISGLRDELENPAHWHIVGFRFDPCVNAAGKGLRKESDFARCISEARLIAQPFFKPERGQGPIQVIDATLHLIYRIEGVAGIRRIVQDLKTVKSVADAAAPGQNPQVFSAHHGLEAERVSGTCGGPTSQAMTDFFRKHTHALKLSQAAFMTVSAGVSQWTFGLLAPNDDFAFISTPIGRFDNFSDSVLGEGEFPLNQRHQQGRSGGTLQLKDSFELIVKGRMGDLNPEEQASARQELEKMNDFMNPFRTTQLNQSCVGCHMAQQVYNELAAKAGVPNAIGQTPYRNSLTFPAFPRKKRNFVNLRNFGYGPGFEPGVSLRSLNEIDRIRNDLNRIYPN